MHDAWYEAAKRSLGLLLLGLTLDLDEYRYEKWLRPRGYAPFPLRPEGRARPRNPPRQLGGGRGSEKGVRWTTVYGRFPSGGVTVPTPWSSAPRRSTLNGPVNRGEEQRHLDPQGTGDTGRLRSGGHSGPRDRRVG